MDIQVTGLQGLEKALSPEIKSVISICDVGTDPKVDFEDRFVLSLRFDDFESAKPLNAPKAEHIAEVVAAFDSLQNRGGSVLIHCHGGVCRSTATAFILKAMLLGPGKEEEAASWTMETFPQAVPNLLVCELADNLLERGGRLLAAMKAFDAEMNRRVLGDDWFE